MRILIPLLLLASIAGNAALWILSRASSPRSEVATSFSSTATSTEHVSVTDSKANTPSPAGAASTSSLTWEGLSTNDLAALAKILRERGYPPHIVKGIVGHYLAEEYEPRRKALMAENAPDLYWKANAFMPATNASQRAELRALNRELVERLAALTGTEATMLEAGSLHMMRHRYGNLPAITLEAVMAIEQDYSELAREIRGTGLITLLPSDREKLALLEEEKQKDLLGILSPEQYEELQLRTSSTAQRLRTSLAIMEPTEQEFRTLHRLQKEYDDRYTATHINRNAPGFREQQRQAEQELIAAAKAELGPERGEAYEKSRDANYVHAHTVARQLNLPQGTGDHLYALQKDAFQELNRIGNAPGLNAEERQAAQRTFVRERVAAIATVVGEDNLSTYRNGMGSWLNAFEQMPNRNIQTAPGGSLRFSRP